MEVTDPVGIFAFMVSRRYHSAPSTFHQSSQARMSPVGSPACFGWLVKKVPVMFFSHFGSKTSSDPDRISRSSPADSLSPRKLYPNLISPYPEPDTPAQNINIWVCTLRPLPLHVACGRDRPPKNCTPNARQISDRGRLSCVFGRTTMARWNYLSRVRSQRSLGNESLALPLRLLQV